MQINPLFRGAVVLGAGLGGFFDGIVLHQILGWHHLVCRTETCQTDSVAVLQQQATEDGFFHLAVWIVTIVGVALVFRSSQAGSGKTGIGGALAGWGLFNFVEGLIDHQVLGIHHVLPGSPHQLLYDLLFLASGVVLVAVGWAVGGRRRAEGLKG